MSLGFLFFLSVSSNLSMISSLRDPTDSGKIVWHEESGSLPRYWPPWPSVRTRNFYATEWSNVDTHRSVNTLGEWNKLNPNVKSYLESEFTWSFLHPSCEKMFNEQKRIYIPFYFWSGKRVQLPCYMCFPEQFYNGRPKRWRMIPGHEIIKAFKDSEIKNLKNWWDLQRLEISLLKRKWENRRKYQHSYQDMPRTNHQRRGFKPFFTDVNKDYNEYQFPEEVDDLKDSGAANYSEHGAPAPRFYQREGYLNIYGANPGVQGAYNCWDGKDTLRNFQIIYILIGITPIIGDRNTEMPTCRKPKSAMSIDASFKPMNIFDWYPPAVIHYSDEGPEVDGNIYRSNYLVRFPRHFEPYWQWYRWPMFIQSQFQLDSHGNSIISEPPVASTMNLFFEKDSTNPESPLKEIPQIIEGEFGSKKNTERLTEKERLRVVSNLNVHSYLKWSEWGACSACYPYKGRRVREGHCYIRKTEPDKGIESRDHDNIRTMVWLEQLDPILSVEPFRFEGIRMWSGIIPYLVLPKHRLALQASNESTRNYVDYPADPDVFPKDTKRGNTKWPYCDYQGADFVFKTLFDTVKFRETMRELDSQSLSIPTCLEWLLVEKEEYKFPGKTQENAFSGGYFFSAEQCSEFCDNIF